MHITGWPPQLEILAVEPGYLLQSFCLFFRCNFTEHNRIYSFQLKNVDNNTVTLTAMSVSLINYIFKTVPVTNILYVS